MKIYGTIGPACASPETLRAMFVQGMTGVRINTSHISLPEAEPQIAMIKRAAGECGIVPDLLIDMQGPELRIGMLPSPLMLEQGTKVGLGTLIPVPEQVLRALQQGQQILLDDGKLMLEVLGDNIAEVKRGGILKSGKSIALPGCEIMLPAMTDRDLDNIGYAPAFGITGVMQPFVRTPEDLQQVRQALDAAGGGHISLLAKIENMDGVRNLTSFFGLANEIVIARGDLGNAMPLWELPRVQDQISRICRAAGVPFMVVTQMLASMENNAVPTRAQVSDIYRAAQDGASSVMVTGETAVGKYPVEVIRYLSRTVRSYTDG